MSLIPFRMKRSNGEEPRSLAAVADFRGEINRLVEYFLGRGGMMQPWAGSSEIAAWTPTVDLAETEDQIRIRAELPGMSADDVDVSVSEDRVVISGEKKSQTETTRNGWTHRESRSGRFSRSIPLPEPIDTERVTARFERGVLLVELAKSEAGTSRRIPVAAG
jgi:HSP20 family protein